MISYIAPIAAGNAVEILLSPPAGALRWRLLRKRADTIAAADDAGANVVMDGDNKFKLDQDALVNGVTYFYRAFYWNGAAWLDSPSRSVIPACTLEEISADVLEIVRDRVDLGFDSLLQRGLLTHPDGHIPVLLATPEFDGAPWPLITVHATHQAQAERFVGEIYAPDEIGGIGDDDDVTSYDGQLMRYTITIIVWCLNGDMRNVMRRYLGAVMQANLPVFEATCMSLVEASFSDSDDVSTYPAPVYQSSCTLTCVAPAVVANHTPVVRQVVAGPGPVPINLGWVDPGPAGAPLAGNTGCTGSYCASCNT